MARNDLRRFGETMAARLGACERINSHMAAFRGEESLRAKKVDTAQQAIVEGLRKCGYWVEVIGQPVDLLVGKDFFNWHLLEVKTPQKNGKRRKRKDQEKQDKFIADTATSVVCTLEEALAVL